MNVGQLESIGKKIADKLDKIRKRIGASPVEYSVERKAIEIEGRELEELAKGSPNKPIIINNKYHLSYIKDHSFYSLRDYKRGISKNPRECFVEGKKVHFYFCSTLTDMTKRGRRSRYRCTPQIRNTQLIDLKGKNTNVETRLAWCKNCIGLLYKEVDKMQQRLDMLRVPSMVAQYKGFDKFMKHREIKDLDKRRRLANKSRVMQSCIAEDADAKELIDCVRSWYDDDSSALDKSQRFFATYRE